MISEDIISIDVNEDYDEDEEEQCLKPRTHHNKPRLSGVYKNENLYQTGVKYLEG